MTGDFDYFVIFAEMRTGSNFLEANLNSAQGVQCLGEAFNPHFIGHPNRDDLLGFTLDDRDRDPAALIDAIRTTPGTLSGFRFFHDHDRRIPDLVLNDPRCAKIILTRNPLDSYVSWKIAQETGQWKLTNITRRKHGEAQFDAAEFETFLGNMQGFQLRLLNTLQRAGQTPFYIAYDDLRDLDVINGLLKWLGTPARLEKLDDTLKPQNPGRSIDKVVNPDEMRAALAQVDRFNLARTPNFEPRRGATVRSYVAAPKTALMYLPIRGGPDEGVTKWLADLDGTGPDGLLSDLNQNKARQWMRNHPGHRRFTVLRHPLLRAHEVFCDKILLKGPGSFRKIRNTLRRRFKLPIPDDAPDSAYSRAQHRDAFVGFLEFLRLNLSDQTAIRVDAHWASQAQILAGFTDFAPPDHILREEELATALPDLARHQGHANPILPQATKPKGPYTLDDIHDAELEALAADIYQRDYTLFGFEGWKPR